MTVSDNRIPVYLWIEAEIRRLASEGVGVYVTARGDKTGGILLQKIANMAGQCRLLIQQRDMSGKLTWVSALPEALVEEKVADDYILRSIARDPDLWVVEIEDRTMSHSISAQPETR